MAFETIIGLEIHAELKQKKQKYSVLALLSLVRKPTTTPVLYV